ncbi:hypothetical protein DJ55_4141 [Yersinia pseudotuberculosis]|nr:hypothetical protein DJ55_4141 [Yersinia pseudotuberculosis]
MSLDIDRHCRGPACRAPQQDSDKGIDRHGT